MKAFQALRVVVAVGFAAVVVVVVAGCSEQGRALACLTPPSGREHFLRFLQLFRRPIKMRRPLRLLSAASECQEKLVASLRNAAD